MNDKPNRGILLRLPHSLRQQAAEDAHADGTSLNFFITQAVAEKVQRMQNGKPSTKPVPTQKEEEEQAAADTNLAS